MVATKKFFNGHLLHNTIKMDVISDLDWYIAAIMVFFVAYAYES
jgi:hypothetical protein